MRRDINPQGRNYPAIGSIVAKLRGANPPSVPAYVAFMRNWSHIAFAGYLGKQYDPFIANRAAKLPIYTLTGEDTGRISGGEMFNLPAGLSHERLADRRLLQQDFDQLQKAIDRSPQMAALDKYEQQAIDMLAGGRIRIALDHSREPAAVRDRYGNHLWCQQVLLRDA